MLCYEVSNGHIQLIVEILESPIIIEVTQLLVKSKLYNVHQTKPLTTDTPTLSQRFIGCLAFSNATLLSGWAIHLRLESYLEETNWCNPLDVSCTEIEG